METKTERELPRVGDWLRPDREWEIWNDNYWRSVGGGKRRDVASPWVAFHPKHGAYDKLPTVEAAIQVAVSFH